MRIDEYIRDLRKSSQEQKEKDRQLQKQARMELKEIEEKIESILSEERKKLEQQYGVPTLRAVCSVGVDTWNYKNEFDKKLNSFKIDTTIKEILGELEKVTGEKFSPQVYIPNQEENEWRPLDSFNHSTITFNSKSHKFVIYRYCFKLDDELVGPEQLSMLDTQQDKILFDNFVKCIGSSRYDRTYAANIPDDVVPYLPLHLNQYNINEMLEQKSREDRGPFFQALTNIYERNQHSENTKSDGGKEDK